MEQCQNCRKDIEKEKMVLHFRMCQQQIKYCEKCQEGIPTEEFEEHELNHTNLKKSTVSQDPLKDSKSSLSLQKKESFTGSEAQLPCTYCSLPIIFSEYAEHEDYCKERITECQLCGETLTFKEIEFHNQSCGTELNDVMKIDKKTTKQMEEDAKLARRLAQEDGIHDEDDFRPNPLQGRGNNNDVGLTEEEQMAILMSQYQDNNDVKPSTLPYISPSQTENPMPIPLPKVYRDPVPMNPRKEDPKFKKKTTQEIIDEYNYDEKMEEMIIEQQMKEWDENTTNNNDDDMK